MPPRLGRTQKLVLEALSLQGPAGATPSMIVAFIRETRGRRVTRNAVWQALQRMARRGLVARLPGGRYRLAPTWSGVYVENFRVAGRLVWSTKELGRPAALEEALTLAALRGLYWPVEQVELFKTGD